MRSLLQALAVSGALIVAAGVVPAVGWSAPPDDASATAAAPASAAAPIPSADIKKAIYQIRKGLRSYAPCDDRTPHCSGNFESFGVALTFSDGTMVPFAHEQRIKQSGHVCIVNARDALARGDRALAVQWVMAAHMDDPLTRNWLGDHPDAVLEGLRRFGG
jgi:hypothetical protein